MKLDRRLQCDSFEEGVGLGGCRFGCVEPADVGLVVFLVVEFHDFLADVRFEGLFETGRV